MQLPDRKAIKDVFEGLLDRSVTIGDAFEPLGADVVPPPGLGVYVEDRGRLSAVVLMDFSLVAHAGAALALVPVVGARIAIEDRVMPANLMDNVTEVLNVLSSPISEASGLHQRLERAYSPHDELPAELAAIAGTLGAREDVMLLIEGYGSGRLAVVSIPNAT